MKKYIALLLLPLALSACGTVRETLGVDSQSGPDEFDVATAPPLSIPPDFNLRPPEPGAPRPQAVNPQTTARELLTGSSAEPDEAEPSAGENILSVPRQPVETAPSGAAANSSDAEDNLLSNVGSTAPAGTGGDNAVATNLDENARVQSILEAPVTRNEAGKLPAIEMEQKGGTWDSWF